MVHRGDLSEGSNHTPSALQRVAQGGPALLESHPPLCGEDVVGDRSHHGYGLGLDVEGLGFRLEDQESVEARRLLHRVLVDAAFPVDHAGVVERIMEGRVRFRLRLLEEHGPP